MSFISLHQPGQGKRQEDPLEELGDRQVVLSDLGAGAVETTDALLSCHLLEHGEHS